MSAAAVAKTGAQHLASLQDGRAVYLDGKHVADVTTHRAFRNAVYAAAALYDFLGRRPIRHPGPQLPHV
jgi:4-hydroxyphenylacetate 3-monooxygenase